ncbi:unnamed protein product [Effrenium voratum]|nr:unnamed protein product [Effrenium voratum]
MPRNEKFDNVVPLGSACFIARHLQQKGLRTCKYPFDWMYSTPYLVRHALSDKFKTFLDITQYQRSSSKGLEKAGTIHKVYQHMQCTQGKKVVFPHHQLFRGSPKARRHRLSYQRAVARLHAVLKGKSGTGPKKTASTLFVLAVAVQTKAKLQAVRDESVRYGLKLADADMVAFHKWLTDFGRRRFGVTGTSARGYDEPSAGAAGLEICIARVRALF